MIDVPTLMSASALQRVVEWAIPRQVQRYNALPLGDRKRELGKAIDLLKDGKISQRLIDHDGDGMLVPFASTEKATTRSYFHG